MDQDDHKPSVLAKRLERWYVLRSISLTFLAGGSLMLLYSFYFMTMRLMNPQAVLYARPHAAVAPLIPYSPDAARSFLPPGLGLLVLGGLLWLFDAQLFRRLKKDT